MPADPRYDEVHAKTRIGSDFRYGCNNDQPMKAGYYAPDRKYQADGTWADIQKFIPHENTTDCRSKWLWETDSGCTGCTKRK